MFRSVQINIRRDKCITKDGIFIAATWCCPRHIRLIWKLPAINRHDRVGRTWCKQELYESLTRQSTSTNEELGRPFDKPLGSFLLRLFPKVLTYFIPTLAAYTVAPHRIVVTFFFSTTEYGAPKILTAVSWAIVGWITGTSHLVGTMVGALFVVACSLPVAIVLAVVIVAKATVAFWWVETTQIPGDVLFRYKGRYLFLLALFLPNGTVTCCIVRILSSNWQCSTYDEADKKRQQFHFTC
mmetsp:Transcript_22836/g.34018  ORF Transcript_22836/g.34018 Transcript_22836/m.34018 type:complete len:240 (-) Transcript_22836:62-781(-)